MEPDLDRLHDLKSRYIGVIRVFRFSSTPLSRMDFSSTPEHSFFLFFHPFPKSMSPSETGTPHARPPTGTKQIGARRHCSHGRTRFDLAAIFDFAEGPF